MSGVITRSRCIERLPSLFHGHDVPSTTRDRKRFVKTMADPMKDLKSPLAPKPFAGDNITEDPLVWLQRFSKFADSKKWTEANKLEIFPLLLTKDAAYWYMCLPDSQKTCFTAIETAFKKQYMPTQHWLNSAIFDRKQGPYESVDEYIAAIRKLCCQASKSDKERTEALIPGLKPDIKSFVLGKEPAGEIGRASCRERV